MGAGTRGILAGAALAIAALAGRAGAEQIVYLNFGSTTDTQTKSDQNIYAPDGSVLITMKKGPRLGFIPSDIGFAKNADRDALIQMIVDQVTADFGDRNITFTTTQPGAGTTYTTINVVDGSFPGYNATLGGINFHVDPDTNRATIVGGDLDGYYLDLSNNGTLHRPDGTVVNGDDGNPAQYPGIARNLPVLDALGIAQQIDKGNMDKNKQAWIFVDPHNVATGNDGPDKNKKEVANSISHELAHLLGIEHDDGVKGSIMGDTNGSNWGNDKDFTDGDPDGKKNAAKKLDGVLPKKDTATPRTRESTLGDQDQHGTSEPTGPPSTDPDENAKKEMKKLRKVLQPMMTDAPIEIELADVHPSPTDPPGLDVPIFPGDPVLLPIPLPEPGLEPPFVAAWIEIRALNLQSVGTPPPSDCCIPHPGPGCDSPGCMGLVCSLDAFCCDVDWDETCAMLAVENCVECFPILPPPLISIEGIPLPGALDGFDQSIPDPLLAGFANTNTITLFLDDYMPVPEIANIMADGVVDVEIQGGGNDWFSIDYITLIVTDRGEEPCPPDTNGDLVIDVTDLVNVILDWGTDGSAHNGDVNNDGFVDVQDLVAVILGWGPCPPGS